MKGAAVVVSQVEAGGKAPQFTLLGDEPYCDASQPDPLGFDQIAGDLAEVILKSSASTPFTLGIEGSWGTGKSSLMKRLQQALLARDVKTVWFNAWTADKYGALEGLVKTVLNSIDRNILRRALRDKQLMTGFRIAITVVAGFFRVGALVDAVWKDLGVDPRTRGEMSALVSESLQKWLAKQQGLPSGKVLVVFVDDLDRCQPTTVLEIFEAIRLYLGTPGFVFVLGYDRNIVSRSILQSQHYDPTASVRDYREKIIQINHAIELPTQDQANRLIERYLQQSGTADLVRDEDRTLILQRSALNPRRIKRFINNVVLEYRLDDDWRELGAGRLVTVLILQYYSPDFLRLVSANSAEDTIGEFIDYMNARSTILKGTSRDSPEWVQVRRVFESWDVPPPSPDDPPLALRDSLDKAVPPEFAEPAQNEALANIVRELALEQSQALRRKLQRRVITLPAEPTPPPAETIAGAPVAEAATSAVGAGQGRRGRFGGHPVPLPQPVGKAPYRLSLDEVMTADAVRQIVSDGKIVFHAVGSTGGVKNPQPQAAVAAAMANELTSIKPAPSFLYILGDIVMFYGDRREYFPQFYEAYARYAAPIFAIPGNHDADSLDVDPPLDGFLRNFCSPKRGLMTEESGGSMRAAMIQPNVYWTLVTPFVTIIGLFTNVPEGGSVDQQQEAWLESELRDADKDRGLVVAMHHSAYSLDQHHSGSKAMGDLLDRTSARAGRRPDLVLAAQVHNYQRFSRKIGQRTVSYIMAGAGGYWNLHRMGSPTEKRLTVPWKSPDVPGVQLEAYDDTTHGYLRLEVNPEVLAGTYMAVDASRGGDARAVDRFAIPLRVTTPVMAGATTESARAARPKRVPVTSGGTRRKAPVAERAER